MLEVLDYHNTFMNKNNHTQFWAGEEMNGLVSTLTLEKPKLLDWPACYMIYYTASSVTQIQ
jgi:hypothetical protein